MIEEVKTKKIYIILTYSGTILSRLIKVYTREKYCHVSVALDENLNEMYSFGRLNLIIHLLLDLFMKNFILEHLRDLKILKQKYILLM